jgi:hypothetical protein
MLGNRVQALNTGVRARRHLSEGHLPEVLDLTYKMNHSQPNKKKAGLSRQKAYLELE